MNLAASATKFFVRITSPAMRLDRAVRLAALFQIALVIFFRAPELRCGLDLGYDRPIESSALSLVYSPCWAVPGLAVACAPTIPGSARSVNLPRVPTLGSLR